jgi:hypothetical protein
MRDGEIITMLLNKRRDYLSRGLTDLVSEVSARLRAMGYFETDEVQTATTEPQLETATRKKPLRRKKG